MENTMKVAVIGAGISGSAFSYRLSQLATSLSRRISVSVFETGRGSGGRTSSRQTRELPGVWFNHGAQLISFSNPDPSMKQLQQFLQSNAGKHAIKPFDGVLHRYDCSQPDKSFAQTSTCEFGDGPFYVGNPKMSSVCEALLSGDGLSVKYDTLISGLDYSSASHTWRLTDSKANTYEDFDVLVITAPIMGNSRFTSVYKLEPPIQALVERLTHSGFDLTQSDLPSIANMMSSAESRPVFATLAAFSRATASDVCSVLDKLPYTRCQVVNHPNIATVLIEREQGQHVTVVLQSTSAFAQPKVHISAREGRNEDTDAIAKSMLTDFLQMIGHDTQAIAMASFLTSHRWGSAFPLTTLDAIVSKQTPFLHDRATRLYCIGDWVGGGSCEGAMWSGLLAAQHVLDGEATKAAL